jgi:hypothetical protein
MANQFIQRINHLSRRQIAQTIVMTKAAGTIKAGTALQPKAYGRNLLGQGWRKAG